jgi:hypothetical protein
MNKIPYKARLWVGVGLILWSIAAFIATIIYGSYGAPTWILVAGPIFAVIAFAIGVVFVPKTNEDGTPIVVERKSKPKKPKNRKPKKQKKPFISDEEWKELEEDDEMMFIEEVVEDD